MLSDVDTPDGGWGWVIVACSFLIHMFVVGTIYSLSVVYVVWLDYFGDGKGITSWVISLAVAVMFGIGPVPGALSRKLGNRTVVILGGILMSSGLAMSYFANNVYFLVVSIGIITGTGAGCCYLPSISLVAMYFTAKRSVAIGIASSGLGAGTFCMAPLLNWLLDYYGWRGSMLILSGISLNMCALGALMRPLKKAKNVEKSQRSIVTQECNISEKRVGSHKDRYDYMQHGDCNDIRGSYNDIIYSQVPTSETESATSYVEDSALEEKLSENSLQSHVNGFSPLTLQRSNKMICASNENNTTGYYHLAPLPNDKNLRNTILDVDGSGKKLGGSIEIPIPDNTKQIPDGKLYSSQMEVSCSRKSASILSDEATNSMAGLNDMQIMLTGSIGSLVFMDKTLRDHSRSHMHSHDSVVIPHVMPDRVGSAGSVAIRHPKRNERSLDKTDNVDGIHPGASLQTYIHLVKDGTFLVFGISNFLTNVSFFMPVLYMVDRALNDGIDKGDAALLISLYGAGNIFGKLFFGWLADRKLVDRLFYYIASLTVCGVATCVSFMSGSSRELHSLYAVTFGCFIGAYVTLVPLVAVDLMGLSLVTESYALLLCFMGIATAFGTPVAGLIFDWTGSYTISFVLHGVVLVISALMLIPLLVVRRRQTSATVVVVT